MKLLVASNNDKKVAEIRVILLPFGIQVFSLKELSTQIHVEETGSTFVQNALLKARTVASIAGCVALADDSGIEVDALNGQPGVMSARFAGEQASDSDKNLLLLSMLSRSNNAPRNARFRCVAAVASPSGFGVSFSGSVDGLIALEPRGACGFGYDPIFYFPPFGRTFGEVPLARKNLVSHRGHAFRLLADFLKVAGSSLLV